MNDQRDGQEGLLRDIYLWATNNARSEEKCGGGKKLLKSSINGDHGQMKQVDMGSGSGGLEVVHTLARSGGVKRNINGDSKMKCENNEEESEDEDEKGIRDLQASEHEKHLLTEKRRRKKMKNMFQELHALLPKQSPKAKLITIVDDAINYIRNLEQTLQTLETQKLERFNRPSTNTSVTSFTHQQKQIPESFSANVSPSTSNMDNVSCPKFLRPRPVYQTWASSNVTLNVCGQDAHINICSSRKPGLLTSICVVLEKCKLDIVSFHISSDQYESMFMIHARVNAPDEFLTAFSYEEIYKLAAIEMMHLVNPNSS